MKIGAHVSISGGLIGAAKEAVSYGANTFMVYTGAPQNTRRSPLEKLKIPEGRAFMAEHGISETVVHAPYIVNLATYKDDSFEHAVSFLTEELKRTDAMGASYFVLHPGSYTGSDLEYGINRIAVGLNKILDSNPKAQICLETMTGKGSEIGGNFSELKQIIEKTNRPDKIKICFDTCHVHDAGYDIVNDLDGVMKQFDDTVGLERLRVFHINGSLNKAGAKKDRHANIGASESNPKGADQIGLEAIKRLVHSDYAQGRLLILETPRLPDGTNLYKREIEMLRR